MKWRAYISEYGEEYVVSGLHPFLFTTCRIKEIGTCASK